MSAAATAIMYIVADNEATVFLNGAQLASLQGVKQNVGTAGGGWGNSPIPTLSLKLAAGTNLLRIRVANAGTAPNPAGLLATIMLNNGTVVVRTNSNCKCCL